MLLPRTFSDPRAPLKEIYSIYFSSSASSGIADIDLKIVDLKIKIPTGHWARAKNIKNKQNLPSLIYPESGNCKFQA